MLRLPVLMLTTIAGILAVLIVWGGDDLRSERRPAPSPAPTVIATEPEPVLESEPAPAVEEAPTATEPGPEPEPTVAEVAGGIERFAGPSLQVSPEFADRADASAEAGEAGLWVTASRLNMRSGPSSGAAVVTSLTGGTGLVPLGPTDGDWVEVRAPSGQTGFVSSQFVTATPPQ